MSSAPADKQDSISEAKAAPESRPSVDHLSTPASALQSGTATPASSESANEVTTAGQAEGATTTESSSKADDASTGVSKAESENTAQDDEEDDDDADAGDNAAKGIQGLQVGEGKKVQEQSAAQAGDAGKSVED